jgi:hypothetical protein
MSGCENHADRVGCLGAELEETLMELQDSSPKYSNLIEDFLTSRCSCCDDIED